MAEYDESAMPSGMPLAPEFDFQQPEHPDDEEEEQQQDSRPSRPADPFVEQDPWKTYERQTTPGQRGQFAGAVTQPGMGTYDGGGGGHPRTVIHDVPPEWDGVDPQRNLEP